MYRGLDPQASGNIDLSLCNTKSGSRIILLLGTRNSLFAGQCWQPPVAAHHSWDLDDLSTQIPGVQDDPGPHVVSRFVTAVNHPERLTCLKSAALSGHGSATRNLMDHAAISGLMILILLVGIPYPVAYVDSPISQQVTWKPSDTVVEKSLCHSSGRVWKLRIIGQQEHGNFRMTERAAQLTNKPTSFQWFGHGSHQRIHSLNNALLKLPRFCPKLVLSACNGFWNHPVTILNRLSKTVYKITCRQLCRQDWQPRSCSRGTPWLQPLCP